VGSSQGKKDMSTTGTFDIGMKISLSRSQHLLRYKFLKLNRIRDRRRQELSFYFYFYFVIF
jgi:hypothetical protein